MDSSTCRNSTHQPVGKYWRSLLV